MSDVAAWQAFEAAQVEVMAIAVCYASFVGEGPGVTASEYWVGATERERHLCRRQARALIHLLQHLPTEAR